MALQRVSCGKGADRLSNRHQIVCIFRRSANAEVTWKQAKKKAPTGSDI
jgi:hypothetical protein